MTATRDGENWIRFHWMFALLAVVLALTSLTGWLIGEPILTSFVEGRPALSPMTIAGLLLAAAAAAVIPQHRAVGLPLSGLQVALGVLVMWHHAMGWPQVAGLLPTWWSSKFTGMLLAISGLASVLLNLRQYAIGQIISFGALLLAALMGLAHLIPYAVLYKALPGTGVAIPTTMGFVAVSLSQLTACRSRGIAGALASHSVAGRTGRRLLLGGAGLVVTLSVVTALAYRFELFDAESAMLLLGWSAMAVLGMTLWGLAVAVDRADTARLKAEKARDQQRSMIMAALSHDLRSPLQAAAMSGVLLQRLVKGEQSLKAVERLQRSHRRLDRMLRSLLDSLALGGGQPLHLRTEAVTLQDVVADVVSENSALLEDRVAWEGEAQGWWDRDAVYRVIENLLLNAAKYGRPETPIWCRIQTRGAFVAVTVENEGEPIPQAQWSVIFEPFQRGPQENSTTPGWGVGLAFAREVATRHGGMVSLLRSDDALTVFQLWLPLDSRPLLSGT